jgi:hypothetical protein
MRTGGGALPLERPDGLPVEEPSGRRLPECPTVPAGRADPIRLRADESCPAAGLAGSRSPGDLVLRTRVA